MLPYSQRAFDLLLVKRHIGNLALTHSCEAPTLHLTRNSPRMDLVVEKPAQPTIDPNAISGQVEALLAKLNPSVTVERRRHVRVAITILFRLTPLDEDRQPIAGQSIVVVGKNISRHGISFIHDRTLSYRRARITLIQPGLGHFDAELDIRWCRFTRPDWYESGGRLIRPATQELQAADWDLPAAGA